MSVVYDILYVDDEMDNRHVFEESFKKDFNITTCSGAGEALGAISQKQFQLIVSDQRMPEMTGVEMFERISKICPDAIRILLTGYSDQQAIIDAINRGKIFYYCEKPWKLNELKMIFLKAIDFHILTSRNKILIADLTRALNEFKIFLYQTSHHLRAPLTTQMGLVNLLKMEVSGMAKVYTEKIEHCVFVLSETLKKLETLSEQGYEKVDEFELTLDTIVADLIARNEGKIKIKDARIITDIHFPVYLKNWQVVSIILDNLLKNSIEYVKPGVTPTITIKAETEGKCLIIYVVDNGIGINLELMQRVFDPFFRGTELSRGSGLGLYLSRKLSESIGATLDLRSNGGGGTEAILRMPDQT